MTRVTGVCVQTALLCSVLLSAIFWPRTGEPVLLVPLGGAGLSSLGVLADEGLAVVGTGRSPRSLIVYRAKPFPILAVLQNGFLPLAAPLGLCGDTGARG